MNVDVNSSFFTRVGKLLRILNFLHEFSSTLRIMNDQTYTRSTIWEADLDHRFCPYATSRAFNAAEGATVVEKFGQSFVWDESLHWTAEELEPLRLVGDEPMDRVLDSLDPAAGTDVFSELVDAAKKQPNGEAALLLQDASQGAAEWVDWDLIAKGQAVFVRHMPAAGVVLYNMSLVGGFSAPKITAVLERSGYLTAAPHAVMRRLFETGRLLVDSCATKDALRPFEAGWVSALRVRILHAKVRRRLLRRQKQSGLSSSSSSSASQSSKRDSAAPATAAAAAAAAATAASSLEGAESTWDVAALGVPINQEDMAVTLLAFSYNVLYGLELILGEPLTEPDQLAYLHLWRYLGHLLGLRGEWNPCTPPPDVAPIAYAKAFLESIIVHQLHPNELSIRVAHHMLRAPAAARRARRAAAPCAMPVSGGDAKGAGTVLLCDDHAYLHKTPSLRTDLAEAIAFTHNAQLTRLLVGDALGDALQLPFDPAARRAARRRLRFLRLYAWASESWLIGGAIERLHRCVLRAVHQNCL